VNLAAEKPATPANRSRRASMRLHHRIREALVRSGVGVDLHHLQQLVGTMDRQLTEQQRVDQIEDGGVGADAERERRDGGERKALVPHERPPRVTQIAAHFVEKPQPEACPGRILVRLEVAEFDPRAPRRLVGTETARHEVRRPRLEVEPQFLVHVALERASRGGSAEEGHKAMEHGALLSRLGMYPRSPKLSRREARRWCRCSRSGRDEGYASRRERRLIRRERHG
jgi:hypothetical protein